MRQYRVGDSIHVFESDESYRDWLLGVFQTNRNNISNVIRQSKTGSELRELYGKDDYILYVNPPDSHKQLMKQLGINHFKSKFRCRQLRYRYDYYEGSSGSSPSAYGKIDSSGHIDISINEGSSGCSASKSYTIISNNIEDAKADVYHWASDDPNHLSAFNDLCNKYEIYKKIKEESAEGSKRKPLYKQAKKYLALELISSILIGAAVMSSFISILASFILSIVVFLFAICTNIAFHRFCSFAKEKRNVDDSAEMMRIFNIIFAVIMLVAKVVLFKVGEQPNEVIAFVLRVGFTALVLIVSFALLNHSKEYLQKLRNSDDYVEDYVNQNRLGDFEERYDFIKRTLIVKSYQNK